MKRTFNRDNIKSLKTFFFIITATKSNEPTKEENGFFSVSLLQYYILFVSNWIDSKVQGNYK